MPPRLLTVHASEEESLELQSSMDVLTADPVSLTSDEIVVLLAVVSSAPALLRAKPLDWSSLVAAVVVAEATLSLVIMDLERFWLVDIIDLGVVPKTKAGVGVSDLVRARVEEVLTGSFPFPMQLVLTEQSSCGSPFSLEYLVGRRLCMEALLEGSGGKGVWTPRIIVREGKGLSLMLIVGIGGIGRRGWIAPLHGQGPLMMKTMEI